MLAVHADWSVDAAKRWMAVATKSLDGWHLTSPEPVGPLPDLFDRLIGRAGGAAVALGVDLPLGVPRAYAAQRPEPDFPTFLRATRDWPRFYDVCAALTELGPERPFYPARGIKGMTRASHAVALGLGPPINLSRACDRPTAERPAGAPLFWTLGANQTGKAAIVAWRDLLLPALEVGAPVRLWPFDGAFLSLLAPGRIVLAETYPAEAMRHLGIPTAGSKRRQSDRAAVAPMLRDAMARLRVVASAELAAEVQDGFGPTPSGEDRFDCVLGVLCTINVLAGHRPDTAPDDPWLHRWEGWVLGQTASPKW